MHYFLGAVDVNKIFIMHLVHNKEYNSNNYAKYLNPKYATYFSLKEIYSFAIYSKFFLNLALDYKEGRIKKYAILTTYRALEINKIMPIAPTLLSRSLLC